MTIFKHIILSLTLFLCLIHHSKSQTFGIQKINPTNKTLNLQKGESIKFQIEAQAPYGLKGIEWFLGSRSKQYINLESPIDYYEQDDWTYEFNDPGNFEVFVYAYDNQEGEAFVYWIIEVIDPIGSIRLTEPDDNENIESGSDFELTWSYSGSFNNYGDLQYFDGSWEFLSSVRISDRSFNWQVPEDLNCDNCKLKIIGYYNDQEDYDISSNLNIAPKPIGSLTLLEPYGLSSIEAGTTIKVNWDYSGNLFNSLDIQYYDGERWIELVSTSISTSSYYWNTPPNLDCDDCRMKILGYYSGGQVVYSLSDVFAVHPKVIGSIEIKGPVSNQVFENGDYLPIEWDFTGNISEIELYFSKDNGTSWELLSSPDVEDKVFLWITDKDDVTQFGQVKMVGKYDTQTISDISDRIEIRDYSHDFICFSGYEWVVRSYPGNPDNNNWSNSSKTVWVDGECSNLHLKIREIGGDWYSSQVELRQTLGYGTYTFKVSSNLYNFDENTYTGFYTYEHEASPENEIDIEFTRENDEIEFASYINRADLTSTRVHWFGLPSKDQSTHQFVYQPNFLLFRSWEGLEDQPRKETLLEEWYSPTPPPISSKEWTIINLWLNDHKPPFDEKDVELIVESFEFEPNISEVAIWTENVWKNSLLPSNNLDVFIDDSFTLSQDFNGSILSTKNLIISEKATLRIDGNKTLEVAGNIDNQGTLIIESGASLITFDPNLVVGNPIIFERNTRFENGQYSFVGIPVAEETHNLGSSLGQHVYWYDEAQGYGASGESRWKSAMNKKLVPGLGYTQAFQKKISLTGIPNHGTIRYSGSYTEDQVEAGWNLVSNPYPSSISLNAFLEANENIIGAIYIWDDFNSNESRGTNADYIIANTLAITESRARSGNRFNGNIGSFQGFFVRLNNPSNTEILFTEDMRAFGNNADGFFFREAQNQLIRLNLIGENIFEQTVIVPKEGASKEALNRLWDAPVFNKKASNLIYSIKSNKYLAIQAVPEESDVKIGMNLEQPGSYSISIDCDHHQDWKLLDTLGNLIHSFKNGEYQFQYESSKEQEFYLSQEKNRPLVPDKLYPPEIYHANGLIYVNLNGLNDYELGEIRLLDMSGKTVLNFPASNSLAINVESIPKGVYIITTDLMVLSKKILIK